MLLSYSWLFRHLVKASASVQTHRAAEASSCFVILLAISLMPSDKAHYRFWNYRRKIYHNINATNVRIEKMIVKPCGSIFELCFLQLHFTHNSILVKGILWSAGSVLSQDNWMESFGFAFSSSKFFLIKKWLPAHGFCNIFLFWRFTLILSIAFLFVFFFLLPQALRIFSIHRCFMIVF